MCKNRPKLVLCSAYFVYLVRQNRSYRVHHFGVVCCCCCRLRNERFLYILLPIVSLFCFGWNSLGWVKYFFFDRVVVKLSVNFIDTLSIVACNHLNPASVSIAYHQTREKTFEKKINKRKVSSVKCKIARSLFCYLRHISFSSSFSLVEKKWSKPLESCA